MVALVEAKCWLIWVVIGYGVIGLILNLITPSAGERATWAPVALVLPVCRVVVATGKPAQREDNR